MIYGRHNTNCGAALGALIYAGEDNSGRWVYGSGLRDLKPDDFVMVLSVSSIVEGIDQTTETHIVDLFDDSFETPDDAAKAYGAALQEIQNIMECVDRAGAAVRSRAGL